VDAHHTTYSALDGIDPVQAKNRIRRVPKDNTTIYYYPVGESMASVGDRAAKFLANRPTSLGLSELSELRAESIRAILGILADLEFELTSFCPQPRLRLSPLAV
jgi:hypothetical protein